MAMEAALRAKFEALGCTYLGFRDPATFDKIAQLFLEDQVGQPKTIEEYMYFGLYFTKKGDYLRYSSLLQEKIESLGCTYQVVPELVSLEKIYRLFLEDVVGSPVNPLEYTYFGLYYSRKEDYGKMLECYRQATQAGFCLAYYNLGVYYMTVGKNIQEGLNLLRRAATLDNQQAVNYLIRHYYITEQYDQMKQYAAQGLALGDNKGFPSLILGRYAELVEQDYPQMIRYYTQSNNSTALTHLANYYSLKGQTQVPILTRVRSMTDPKNAGTPRTRFRSQTEPDIQATWTAPRMKAASGVYETKNNWDMLAEEYYLKAISMGNSDAMCCLASHYFERQNYLGMKSYFHQADRAGNEQAWNNLGYYYHNIEQNAELMKFYYEKAVEVGVVMAMINLAHYYTDTEPDVFQMRRYYLRAIEAGSAEAVRELSLFYWTQMDLETDLWVKYLVLQPTGYSRREAQVLLWVFRTYAEKGHDGAIQNLTTYYRIHNVVEGFQFGIRHDIPELIEAGLRLAPDLRYWHCLLQLPNHRLAPHQVDGKYRYVEAVLSLMDFPVEVLQLIRGYFC